MDSAALMRWLLPISFVLGGFLVGIIIERIVLGRLRRLLSKTHWDGFEVIIRSLKGIPTVLLGVGGLDVALNNIEISRKVLAVIQQSILAVVILAVTLVVARLSTGFLNLYKLRSKQTEGISISLFANLVKLVIILIGLMIILQTLGVSITPLLTALGIGGLAVALALQDTLSNLFAGLVIIISGHIKRGDYVELESGEKGYVSDITWKNTVIRAIPNNMIIVPNSKLSSTILTNYYQPQKDVLVRVDVGVSYESDLKKVEKVTVEVAKEVMQEVKGGVPSFEPYLRYHTFSDFSINFTVMLSADEYFDQYLVKHEFIKRLHERYGREGIVIPFPIRTVQMMKEGVH